MWLTFHLQNLWAKISLFRKIFVKNHLFESLLARQNKLALMRRPGRSRSRVVGAVVHSRRTRSLVAPNTMVGFDRRFVEALPTVRVDETKVCLNFAVCDRSFFAGLHRKGSARDLFVGLAVCAD